MAVSQFYKDNSEKKDFIINSVPISATITKTPVETLFTDKELDNSACFSGNTTKYFTDIWYGTNFKVEVSNTSPNVTLKINSAHELFSQSSSKMLLTYNNEMQVKQTATNLFAYTDNRNIYNNSTGSTTHSMFADVKTRIVTDFDVNRIVLVLYKCSNMWDNNAPSFSYLDTGTDNARQNGAFVKVFYRKDNYTLTDISAYFNIAEVIHTDTDILLNQVTNNNLLLNSLCTTGMPPFKDFNYIPPHGTGNTIAKIDNKYLAHSSDFNDIYTDTSGFQQIIGDADNVGVINPTYWNGGVMCKFTTTAFVSQLKKILASFGLRFIYCNPKDITDKTSYDANIKLAYMDEDGYVNPDVILNGSDEINASDTHNKDIDYNIMPVIPDTPNSYPREDNKINPMDYRLSNQIGGFTTYYKVTRDDLARIINAVNHPADDNPIPEGYEFLPHVVSVAQYPFNISQYVHGTNGNVVIGGYDTRVSALSLDSTQLAVQDIATISIPAKYKNFLDKSPYTQIELFIPLCGWVVLPDIVVGNTINVSLSIDPINLGCIGKVTMNGLVIAEKSGKMGTPISISATENGLKNAALTQAMFNVMGATLSTGYALSTGNPVGAVSGVMSVAGAISQGNIANNSNYTRAVGNTGDMSENHISNSCYLKITFPLADIPENFGHTYGYMCNETHKLSECKGFTVCDNPDLSGITATENEKQRLKALLTSGIYC